MGNGNHLLDEFVRTVAETPVGQRIKAPWSKFLLGDGEQAAAVALIQYGIIGMSDTGTLYLGRNRVGNPFYRMLNGWFLYPLMLAYVWTAGHFAIGHGTYSTVVGLILAGIGVGYFGAHFLPSVRYSMLFVRGASRRGELVKLGSLAIGLTSCIGVFIGLVWRVGNGLV